MPNPKRKHSKMRRDRRRASNWKIESQNLNKCPNCGIFKQPHCICKACGFYNGELILPKKTKKKETTNPEEQK